MKISFPYMGCVTGYQKLFELLGHEVIPPQKPTQRTIDLGVLHSPEFICYPFKVMMGTYIEACEKGANLIVSSGGSGPCRAGLYGEVHQRILRQMGYDVQILIFDSIFENTGYFLKQLVKLKNKTPFWKVLRHLWFAFRLICQMDALEKEIKKRRAYELRNDSFQKCWAQIVQLYLKSNTFSELKRAKRTAWDMLDSIPLRLVEEKDRVRIGIVGEIYVIMESAANMDIEQRLNAMGVEVTNVQYISDWLLHNLIPRRFNKSKSWQMYDKAKPYKSCNCGGHDTENAGWMVHFAEQGYDGVVHLMPFGCLPELVVRSIIPTLSETLDLPVLSISLDEQQGEANLQTRLEAFVDLCRNKKGEVPATQSEQAPEIACKEHAQHTTV